MLYSLKAPWSGLKWFKEIDNPNMPLVANLLWGSKHIIKFFKIRNAWLPCDSFSKR